MVGGIDAPHETDEPKDLKRRIRELGELVQAQAREIELLREERIEFEGWARAAEQSVLRMISLFDGQSLAGIKDLARIRIIHRIPGSVPDKLGRPGGRKK